MKKRMPVLFVGHGSPMIALEENRITENFKLSGDYIKENYGQPKAILAISAHWYTNGYFTQDEENPKQIYDMYGFPKELYEVKYEVKGCKDLTERVLSIEDVEINNQWGIDHGTWTVLKHMFPSADIGIVQLSVNLDASIEEIYEMGKKLEFLRDEGYLIIGSGNIVHNLAAIQWDNGNGTKEADEFDEFIKDAILNKEYDKVINYKEHKYSSYAVPTMDHFLPLIYVLGAANNSNVKVFNNLRNLGSISMTSYIFE